MKFADDTKLEGVTNNNADRGLIQMDLKKFGKSQQCPPKKEQQIELIKIFIGKVKLEKK